MGSDQRVLTSDAVEACKKLGIRSEDLMPKQLEDFIDKNTKKPEKEENLANARLTHFQNRRRGKLKFYISVNHFFFNSLFASIA